LQEDVDTFETILAQCTAFLERAPPPKEAKKARGSAKSSTRSSPTLSKSKLASKEELPAYDPGNFAPGEGYVNGSQSAHPGGKIVLVDEEDGSVIGELGEGYQVIEDSMVKPGSKGRSCPTSNARRPLT
jgi:spartin